MTKGSGVYIARSVTLVYFEKEAVMTLAELLDDGLQQLDV